MLMNSAKKIYFFFPYYHTGGAEKVHLQIVKSLNDYDCTVFFTDRSRDNKNKKDFFKNAKCYNLFGLTNKIKLLEKFFVYFLAKKISKEKDVVVFGSNSRFFYSLLPKLNKDIEVVDLIHWLDGEVGEMAIKNSSRINKRIVVTEAILSLFVKKYKEFGLNQNLLERVQVIENFISPSENLKKDYGEKLNVLYIGRDTSEKRAQLVFVLEEQLREVENIEFTFIGRGIPALGKKMKSQANYIELVKDEEKLNEIYKKAHIIVLTSSFEGFPCVIAESIGFGVVPVVTAVGGLSLFLNDGVDSLLINDQNEDIIVQEMKNAILNLNEDRVKLKKMSERIYQSALEGSGLSDFQEKYKNLFKTDEN